MGDMKINIEELKSCLGNCGPDTRLYLGADSERVKLHGVWYADYITVIVVHINGCNGGRVFYQVERQRDYDSDKKKPTTRLINEVLALCSLYKEHEELLENYEVELHMDINSVKNTGSNHVLSQAIGMVRGMCGIDPKCKPDAWAASFAADRAKELSDLRTRADRAGKAGALI